VYRNKDNMNFSVNSNLNEAQILLLNMLNTNYSEKEINELREILLAFNNRKLQVKLDEFVVKNSLTREDFQKLAQGQFRNNIFL